MSQLSLVTNVTLGESGRIEHVLPHWLRTFDQRLSDLTVVFDRQGASGRIRDLHGEAGPVAETENALRRLEDLDGRVKVVVLPEAASLQELGRRWFGDATVPDRCQAGTPILAFLYAISLGKADVVVRSDCDMLFRESGWLQTAIDESARYDLVEPARLGWDSMGVDPIPSTRCMVLRPARIEQRLPLRPLLLGPLRTAHRRLLGRGQWLSLERTLADNVEHGELSYRYLDGGGFSIHLTERGYCDRPWISDVVSAVEAGDIPLAQHSSHNFEPAAWGVR